MALKGILSSKFMLQLPSGTKWQGALWVLRAEIPGLLFLFGCSRASLPTSAFWRDRRTCTHIQYVVSYWKVCGRPKAVPGTLSSLLNRVSPYLRFSAGAGKELLWRPDLRSKGGRYGVQVGAAHTVGSWSVCFNDNLGRDSSFSHWSEKLLSLQSQGMLVIVMLV